MKKELLLGAHMSIAGGVQNAIIRGQDIGCTAIQVFTKSNRQWHAKPLAQKDIELFKETWKNSDIASVSAHASYLINIGSPNKEVAKKSVAALIKEIERCAALGITYLTLHPGARLKDPKDECLNRIAENLDTALSHTPSSVTVSLETMAGQGSNVCDTFQDIAHIMQKSSHTRRISVTLDTCHLYAAGYDITTKKSYESVLQEFDKTIGIHKIKIIHINDSKRELESHVDRHEEIGKGKLGLESFKLLMNDPRFFDVPKILETPKIENYKKNMDILKSLLSEQNKKLLQVS